MRIAGTLLSWYGNKMRYTGYFTAFGKRFKYNIDADSSEQAKEKIARQVMSKIEFDEPRQVYETPGDNEIFESLKDLFRLNKDKP
jgi:hypothetical protein